MPGIDTVWKELNIGNGKIEYIGIWGEHKNLWPKCPYCERGHVLPEKLYGDSIFYSEEILFKNEDGEEAWFEEDIQDVSVVLRCPGTRCNNLFIADYTGIDGNAEMSLIMTRPIHREHEQDIPNLIKEISPQFVTTYSQAKHAQHEGLEEIAGPGFRKALELLIKDYAMLVKPAERESIKRLFLGDVIRLYIKDSKLRKLAERAVWLGNDEAHYVRHWEDKTLNDLLVFTRLVVDWIEVNKRVKTALQSMNVKKK
jgi:hypothetical protein